MGIPLTPSTGGGQCIDTAALLPADIIVSTTNARISRAIRSASGSSVSHAMIYVGNNQVIEAIGEGVVQRSIYVAVQDAVLAVAYRHVQISPPIAQTVISFARNQLKRSYDVTGIVGQAGYQLDRWFLCTLQNVRNCDERAARANLWMQSSNRFFCSELVAEAYRRAGIPFINTPASRVSPQTIVEVVSSGKLEYVGHIKP